MQSYNCLVNCTLLVQSNGTGAELQLSGPLYSAGAELRVWCRAKRVWSTPTVLCWCRATGLLQSYNCLVNCTLLVQSYGSSAELQVSGPLYSAGAELQFWTGYTT